MGLRVCLYMALYSCLSPFPRFYPLKRKEIENEINERIPFPKEIKEEKNLYHSLRKRGFDWYWWGRGLYVYFEVEDENKELIRKHYERLWKEIIEKVYKNKNIPFFESLEVLSKWFPGEIFGIWRVNVERIKKCKTSSHFLVYVKPRKKIL